MPTLTRLLPCLILLVATAGAAAPPPPSSARLSFRVEEREGVRREAWPLTFGAPFPRGSLADGTAVRVEDRGRPLPTQTRVVARWPDGSVRWLLVDTEVSLGPEEKKTFEVRSGAAPAPAARLAVEDVDEYVGVDTGAVRFRIPKKRFAVLDRFELASGRNVASAGMISVLLPDGELQFARPPQRVSVLESGPLRVRIEIRGDHGNGFDYVIRIEAYAGQPFVRVLHTLIDRNGATFVGLSRVGVELPLLPPEGPSYSLGVENGSTRTGALGREGVRAAQLDNLRYRVGDDASEGKLAGWAEVRGQDVAVGIAARWFWQEYPKAIEVRPDRLVYDVWAPEGGTAKVGTGAAKTHEFVVWAAPSAQANAARALATPLVAAVDPHAIARSGALPHAIDPPADGFAAEVVSAAGRYLHRNARERWDDSGRVRCAAEDGEVPRVGAYGMLNWGDWNFPGYHDDTKGCDAWGNLEYDTTLVLALAFAASGRAELHEAMVAAARHFTDVDRIHFYRERPSWVGMNHPKNPLHFTFDLGGIDLGHTWNEGLLAYYYLTGDERGREGVLEIADYLVERINGFIFRGNPRQWGWPQIALMAAYDLSGEAKYREAALGYARRGIEAHQPTEIRKWKLGILADGLAYTHAATGDAKVFAWLERYANTVTSRKAPLDGRLYPAVAYMAGVTGDAKMRATALRRVRRLKLGNWGKPFSINGRLGFRIHSLLQGRDGGKTMARLPEAALARDGSQRGGHAGDAELADSGKPGA